MELSIEEKAKAYDESKARMKAAWDSNRCTLGFMTEIFPELKESKDEKIRRIVYGWINTQPSGFFNLNDISKKDMLAWLEKREEKKRNWGESEEAYFEFTQAAIENCYDENNPLRKELVAWLKDKVRETINKSNKPFRIEHNKYYLCIKDYFSGGCCRAKKGDVVLAKNGLSMMALSQEEAPEYFMPINPLNDTILTEIRKQEKPKGKLALEAIKEEKVDNANKVEPKLNIGDWVVRKDGNTFTNGRKTVQITKIIEEQYWFDCETWLEAKDIRLWTIADAKDGDVLVLNDKIFIYACKRQGYNMVRMHCYVDSAGGFHTEWDFLYTEKENLIHPATAGQIQMLFVAMYDAGYSWRNKQLIKR